MKKSRRCIKSPNYAKLMMEVNAMALDVTCNVRNCRYNKSKLCKADAIKVSTDGCEKALSTSHTKCHTFEME